MRQDRYLPSSLGHTPGEGQDIGKLTHEDRWQAEQHQVRLRARQ